MVNKTMCAVCGSFDVVECVGWLKCCNCGTATKEIIGRKPTLFITIDPITMIAPIRFGCIHQKEKYENEHKGDPVDHSYLDPCWNCEEWASELEKFEKKMQRLKEKRLLRKYGYSDAKSKDCPEYTSYVKVCRLMPRESDDSVYVNAYARCNELPRLLKASALEEKKVFEKWYNISLTKNPNLSMQDIMEYKRDVESENNTSIDERNRTLRYIAFLTRKVKKE